MDDEGQDTLRNRRKENRVSDRRPNRTEKPTTADSYVYSFDATAKIKDIPKKKFSKKSKRVFGFPVAILVRRNKDRLDRIPGVQRK